MLPEATVVHVLAGRARLRLSDHRRDAELFRRIGQGLTEMPSVVSVETNAATGSILIIHEHQLEEILRRAEEQELFRMVVAGRKVRPSREDPPPWVGLFDEVVKLDGRLRSESGQRWGVGSLTFYGLMAGFVLQVYRGQVFPAATTLLLNATGILRELNKGRPPPE